MVQMVFCSPFLSGSFLKIILKKAMKKPTLSDRFDFIFIKIMADALPCPPSQKSAPSSHRSFVSLLPLLYPIFLLPAFSHYQPYLQKCLSLRLLFYPKCLPFCFFFHDRLPCNSPPL